MGGSTGIMQLLHAGGEVAECTAISKMSKANDATRKKIVAGRAIMACVSANVTSSSHEKTVDWLLRSCGCVCVCVNVCICLVSTTQVTLPP